MLPDSPPFGEDTSSFARLNAPTGAWCSLTWGFEPQAVEYYTSQCTYRCVVLPDEELAEGEEIISRSQCTYRCVVLPDLP